MRKKNIILLVLAIIIIGAGFGFYMYNKGPADVKNAKGIKISAVELYHAFVKDSAQAKKNYAEKILEVSGLVTKVSKNQENQVIVMLQTNEGGAYINCTMEEEAVSLAENEQATVKGICSGMGMGEPDLGILGDVYLIRCYRTK